MASLGLKPETATDRARADDGGDAIHGPGAGEARAPAASSLRQGARLQVYFTAAEQARRRRGAASRLSALAAPGAAERATRANFALQKIRPSGDKIMC